MSEAAASAVVFAVIAIGFAVVIFGIVARLQAARARTLQPLPGGGVRVPVAAAFGAPKKFTLLGYAHNTLNPRLELHPDHVLTRLLRTRRRSYDQIERVDVRNRFGGVDLLLDFDDSSLNFTASHLGAAAAAAALRWLADRGCPLTERARALLVGQAQ